MTRDKARFIDESLREETNEHECFTQHFKESMWFCLECQTDFMLYIRNQRSQHYLLYLPQSLLPVLPGPHSFFLCPPLTFPFPPPAPVALCNLPPFVCTRIAALAGIASRGSYVLTVASSLWFTRAQFVQLPDLAPSGMAAARCRTYHPVVVHSSREVKRTSEWHTFLHSTSAVDKSTNM